jgi:hypothetical protein
MKSLEIISLRALGNLEQQTHGYLRSFCLNIKNTNILEANFYVNAFIPGDLAIVLLSQTEKDKKQKTAAEVILADALKRFGLEDHTCWLMIKDLREHIH